MRLLRSTRLGSMSCAAQRKFHVLIEKLLKCFTVGILLLAANVGLYAQAVCTPVAPPPVNGICSSAVQQFCVSACDARCGDDVPCKFGCQIGGINNVDTCTSSCSNLSASCLNNCMKTVRCITNGCTDLTSALKINRGT